MNAICPLSQVAVRIEPSDKSEIITQVLFGETFSILEEQGNWLLIRIHLDGYTGWIDRKQSFNVTQDFIDQIRHKSGHFIADRTGICFCKNDHTQITLTKGSRLPLLHKGTFQLENRYYTTGSKTKIVPRIFKATRVSHIALDYLNVPYLWGGRSMMGVDCSGLVQVVYHMCGKNLPRDAAQQVKEGNALDFVDEALPGDLAFFDNPAGEIIHVGIIIGPGKILHASGHVKIDKIDHNGIFCIEQGKYTHSLRIIKRL
ncbi:MAG: C40 family peptidase [Bacteroidota bacterium]